MLNNLSVLTSPRTNFGQTETLKLFNTHLYTNRIPDHGLFSMIHEKEVKMKMNYFLTLLKNPAATKVILQQRIQVFPLLQKYELVVY